jgi:glycosyltransferase involved in cell wall biosynthesis
MTGARFETESALVTVIVLTYNQAGYIGRAIESALAQQTFQGEQFPLTIAVYDDGSTDGTVDEIRRIAAAHLGIVSVQVNDTNTGLVQRQSYLAQRAVETPFFCILEGDDFYIDHLKLASQCAVLEADAGLVACGHDTLNEYEDQGGRRERAFPSAPTRDISGMAQLIRMAAPFHISSVLFRNVFGGDPPKCLADGYACEMTMYMVYGEHGDFFYIGRPMSVRLVHRTNSFAHRERFGIVVLHLKGFRSYDKHLGHRYTEHFAEAGRAFARMALGEVRWRSPKDLRFAGYFLGEWLFWSARLLLWRAGWRKAAGQAGPGKDRDAGMATPAPLICAGLWAPAASHDAMQLSFWPASYATSYQYRVNGGEPLALASNRVVTGLSPSTTYSFEVRGVTATGHGPWSNVANGTTAAVPLPVAVDGLSATPTSQTQVELSFSDPAHETSYEYRIDGGSNAALPRNRVVEGLCSNTAYDFEVRAINSSGAGVWSNVASATTQADPLPGATGTLSVSGASRSTVQLAFALATGAAFHQYRINGGSEQTLEGDKIVTGLAPSTTYDFQVRGVNQAGGGAWSNVAAGTTSRVPVPAAVSDLSATTTSQTQVELSFTNPEHATSCQYRIGGGGAVALPGNRVVEGLAPETTYEFEVRAINSSGAGWWSNVASAATWANPHTEGRPPNCSMTNEAGSG